MLEHEGPHGVGVTLCADRELACGRTDLVPGLRAMWVMAIAALNESDIDSMAIRSCELGALLGVASVAELSLRLDQHEVHVRGFMRTMTACAADTISEVLRLGKVLSFKAGLVTLRADGRGLSWAQRLKANDLCDIAAAIDVSLSGTMTSLTPMLIALQKCGMRRASEVLVPDLLVTGLANIRRGVLSAGRPR